MKKAKKPPLYKSFGYASRAYLHASEMSAISRYTALSRYL